MSFPTNDPALDDCRICGSEGCTCDPYAPEPTPCVARRPARSFGCGVCFGDLTAECSACDRLSVELAADLAGIERGACNLPAYLTPMEWLAKWNRENPVDLDELDRNAQRIAS